MEGDLSHDRLIGLTHARDRRFLVDGLTCVWHPFELMSAL